MVGLGRRMARSAGVGAGARVVVMVCRWLGRRRRGFCGVGGVTGVGVVAVLAVAG